MDTCKKGDVRCPFNQVFWPSTTVMQQPHEHKAKQTVYSPWARSLKRWLKCEHGTLSVRESGPWPSVLGRLKEGYSWTAFVNPEAGLPLSHSTAGMPFHVGVTFQRVRCRSQVNA